MCGIAGYIGGKKILPERIDSCLPLMQNRGPDNSGVYENEWGLDRYVCLLHSRLSILDLDDRSNQPFRQGSKVITFNGEIYNYVELKKMLVPSSGKWRASGDTEVLATVLEQQGKKGLCDCEGMWALACYDEVDGSLLLSRDRFGEKPLYIWRKDDGLYFGSEVKFIAALAGRWPEININQIKRSLVYGFRSLYKEKETFFTDVELLPQAAVIEVLPSNERHSIFWKPRFRPDDEMTYQDAVSGARERIIKSMELRLRADVPLAFCMSGGIDSNSLISIAKRELGYDVHGFTFNTSDVRYDEMELINKSVTELDIQHTVVEGNSNAFLPQLKTLIKYHDAPVHTVTWYANWLLMKAIAAKGYKIAINGIAADELFSGYYEHHLAYLAEVESEPELYQLSLNNWEKEILPFVRNQYLRDPELLIKNPEFRGHHYLKAEIFSSYLKSPFYQTIKESRFTNSILRNRMLNEMFYENVPVYMHEEDLNAMYFSIENRTPYLDRDLFDFCYTIPSHHLVQNGMAKSVLRDAVRGIVPEHIINCPQKVGFNAPIFAFLDTSDKRVEKYVLDDSPIFEYIKREAIQGLLEKDTLLNSDSKFLFTFLNCKMFLEEFA